MSRPRHKYTACIDCDHVFRRRCAGDVQVEQAVRKNTSLHVCPQCRQLNVRIELEGRITASFLYSKPLKDRDVRMFAAGFLEANRRARRAAFMPESGAPAR